MIGTGLSILMFLSPLNAQVVTVSVAKLSVDQTSVSLSHSVPRITFTPAKVVGMSWSSYYTIAVAISDSSNSLITQVSCGGSFRNSSNVLPVPPGTQSFSIDCDYIGGSDNPMLIVNVNQPTQISVSGSLITTQIIDINP